MVNWAYVHGVNMLVPITYKYSMRGVDHTVTYPGITYQQPYWQELRPFSDYVSRLSYLLSQGHFHRAYRVSAAHPDVRANWQDREYVEGLTAKTHWLTNALMRAGYDFDFIDDASVEQSSIQNGQLTIRGNAHGTILLPPMRVGGAFRLSRSSRSCDRRGATCSAWTLFPMAAPRTENRTRRCLPRLRAYLPLLPRARRASSIWMRRPAK